MYNKPTSLSYLDSGFNKFFSRTITPNSSTTLQESSQTAGSKDINFDNFSTSGSVGDKIQVGGVTIDGSGKRVVINDSGSEVSVFGNNDGTFGLFFFNQGGKKVSENNGATEIKYDASGVVYYRVGELLDGTYGFALYDSTGNIVFKNTAGTETRYYIGGAVKSTDDGTTITRYYSSGVVSSTDNGTTVTRYYPSGTVSSTDTGTTQTKYYASGVVQSVDNGTTTTKYDTSGNILSVDNGNRVVYYDASDARILIGKDPSGVMGFWISKLGEDVVTLLT